MSKKIRTAIIAVALALTFALMAISVPALLAAEKISLSASSTVKFTTTAQQMNEINNGGTGLKCEVDPETGTLVMQHTDVSIINSTSPTAIKKQHDALINDGILRYAMYSGSLCSHTAASSQENENLQLIVILDFTNYNISQFQEGFLSGLVYALLGSNEREIFFIKRGYKHTVKNVKEADGDEVSLTVYDSKNGGKVIDNHKYVMTLQGIYESGSDYTNSTVSIDGGEPKSITHYSVRIVLPGNQTVPVTLQADSLKIVGAEVAGFEIGAPKQPDCIGLGISHLGITPFESEKSIVVKKGAASTSHFHWLSVTDKQMQYAFNRTLDNILDATLDSGYADEIFKKPHTNSDFSHLYISSKKTGVSSAILNILDSPAGELTESASGIAAAVRLVYWYHTYKMKYNADRMNLTFNHYRRSATNEVDPTPGVLKYDENVTYTIGGETCYAVTCGHFTTESGDDNVIGYFSESGKLYNTAKNEVHAE